jgi:hypothetical protein
MKNFLCFPSVVLVLTTILIVPVSALFSDQKLTRVQKAALRNCNNDYQTCVSVCGASNINQPLSRKGCAQDCDRKYNECVDRVVPRRAPRDAVSGGLSSPPPVAPPKPTPRKISPQAVGAVSTDRAPSTSTSATSTIQEPVRGIDSSRQSSPTPARKPAKKSSSGSRPE